MGGVLAALSFLLTFAFFLAPPPVQAQEQQQKIVIGGAQSIVPLAERFSSQFRKKHPGVEIEIVGGGSNYGVSASQRGEIDIGLISRSLSTTERAAIYAQPFGQDAILILTYPGNRVGNLALEQIRGIYLGEITNWRQVGGEDQGIIPLTREKSSGIHSIFIQTMFGSAFNGQEMAFTLRASKEKVLKTIKRIEGIIGYGILRLQQAQAQGIKTLAIDGKAPTEGNIREGLYPLVRPQLVISRGRPEGLRREWMEGFVQFATRATTPEDRP